jgi:DNA-binding NtrC family response regulator
MARTSHSPTRMQSLTRVLVVDADAARAQSLVALLAPGHDAFHAHPADAASAAADVALLALDPADPGAVARLAADVPDADLVVLAGPCGMVHAGEALRLGARDVVSRDAGAEALLFAVDRVARERRNRRELAVLRARVGGEAREALVGSSAGMSIVRDLVARAAASRGTVLVTGEPGTGKSTVARLVHDLSDRAARPFVVARGDADGDVLESELFGTDRGGLLETTHGGTIVIDEVRALSHALRARLAAVLADRVLCRRGSALGQSLDVRLVLIARTSSDEPAPDASSLLGDRPVLPIALPPLRERRRDIPLLAQHFRERLVRVRGGEPAPLSAESLAPLLAHSWPGNVRELEHWMERIVLAGEDDPASPRRRSVVAPGAEFAALDAARLTLDALERRYILHVMAQEGGHQSRAADRLGIDRRTLYRKLKEYRNDGVRVRLSG